MTGLVRKKTHPTAVIPSGEVHTTKKKYLALLFIFVMLCSAVNFALLDIDILQAESSFTEPRNANFGSTAQSSDSHHTVIPPYLISPPQAMNGYQSVEDQCLRQCLSAYEASPYNRATERGLSDGVTQRDKRQFPPPPRILHFIFIGDIHQDEFVRFTFTDYLMIRAAYFRLQPDEIYLHSNVPPLDSPHWDLIRPMISVQKHLEPITEIYGNVVTGKAHFSDVARLRVLQEYGGMYMDIDSICLRPFTKNMWDPPSGMTMGYESKERHHIGCGVIIARKDSMFLKRWLESYKTFNDKQWADHTVLMAGKLANEHPDEIDVLPETHFYRPSWRPESIKLLWEEQPADDIHLFNFSQAYAPHYWGTIARKAGRIDRMSAQTIVSENVGIHQILRPLLPNPYFSLAVHCSASPDAYWKIQSSIDAIVNQSFPLWEILLVEDDHNDACSTYVLEHIVSKSRRLTAHLPKSIRTIRLDGHSIKSYAHGIWLIELGVGQKFSASNSLEQAVNRFHEDSVKRVWHFDGEKRIEFIYDSSRGISRVPRPLQD